MTKINYARHTEEFKQEGTTLIRNCLRPIDFQQIDAVLEREWQTFHVANGYTINCATFAKNNPNVVTKIYTRVADLPESLEIGRNKNIRKMVGRLIGENAKIYGKIPLRIDVPLETKELAPWHQDDFYVEGAPNEVTAWIPLQDTPMQMGALSVIKKKSPQR